MYQVQKREEKTRDSWAFDYRIQDLSGKTFGAEDLDLSLPYAELVSPSVHLSD